MGAGGHLEFASGYETRSGRPWGQRIALGGKTHRAPKAAGEKIRVCLGGEAVGRGKTGRSQPVLQRRLRLITCFCVNQGKTPHAILNSNDRKWAAAPTAEGLYRGKSRGGLGAFPRETGGQGARGGGLQGTYDSFRLRPG